MSGSAEKLFRGGRGRVLAAALVLFFVTVGVGGFYLYGAVADPNSDRVQIGNRDVVLLQLSGSSSVARSLVCRGLDTSSDQSEQLGTHLRPRAHGASCAGPVNSYQHAITADWLFIAGYVVALGGLCWLGMQLFHEDRARSIARQALVATLVAAAVDVVEDLLIYRGLDTMVSGGSGRWWQLAAAAALTKFVLLLPAIVVAATAGIVVLVRARTAPADFAWTQERDKVRPPAPVFDDRGQVWPKQSVGAPTMGQLGREPAAIGVCVSGGGIRSASVALGALQVLREKGELARARYLVSVSGGGYLTGALQLALQPLTRTVTGPDGRQTTEPVPTVQMPETLFGQHTPEVDHVRRHGRYVADGGKEWASAMGTILRGLAVSLGLIAAVVTTVGVVLGRFYFEVPMLSQEDLVLPGKGRTAPGFPPVNTGAGLGLALLVGAGLTVWFMSILFYERRTAARVLREIARALFLITAVVLLLGVAVPALCWFYVRGLWWLDAHSNVSVTTAVTAGSGGSVGLAYLGTLASILWRKRVAIGDTRKKLFGGKSALQRQVPTSLSQRLLVWAVLLVLAVAYGALLTAVIWATMRADAFAVLAHPLSASSWHVWPQAFVVLVPLVLVVVTAFIDQTWTSLHPFYRRRLATAFAVRRVLHGDAGVPVAEPYSFNERTSLSTYAAPRKGMPQVIFSAAANLSGFDRVPPGRRAASYSLSHDWIGGPAVGYVRTDAIEQHVSPSLRRDLTVQSAVAVSGAAFASAMGRQARAFQTLLALSNARLGTWLPNPAWLSQRDAQRDWRQPRLPSIRRLSYLLREVVGSYDSHDRLLLVTDGGHYENLGLVELLRHQVRTAYCIDSSGDALPLAGAVADAMALAEEELGVRIELDNPLDLVPGSGAPLDPQSTLAELSGRLSRGVVVTGRIIYPTPFTVEGETEPSNEGRLILAKTRLTGEMPSELLSYAQSNPVFPHDSTSDQWFDQGQFNAYHALGRCLGEAASVAATVPREVDLSDAVPSARGRGRAAADAKR